MTSNFIVDMKPQTLQKIIFWFFIAFCAALPLVGLAYYLNDNAIYFTSTVLTSFGFFGFLLFLIAITKKEVAIKNNISYPILLGILLLSTLSTLFAVDKSLALYGTSGRYEGLLAIIAYGGIFLAGSLIYVKKSKLRLFDMLIFVGIIQSIIGILQHIPALEHIIPSLYNRFAITTEAFIANGLTGSPFFLAALLAMLAGIAISGAIYDKSIIRRWVYGISTILFVIAALFTQVIPSLIGISVAVITICIIEIVRVAKKHTILSGKILQNPLGRLSIIFIAVVSSALIVFFAGGLKLQDKTIMYQDSFYRLWITGGESVKDKTPIYEHTWSEGFKLVKEYPILGAGADCVTKALYNTTEPPKLATGTIDRPYNEYLYVAISRGILTLLAYLALLFFTIRKCIKSLKLFYSKSSSWIDVAITTALVAYIVQAFFNMSSITVAPIFWLLLGLAWSKQQED